MHWVLHLHVKCESTRETGVQSDKSGLVLLLQSQTPFLDGPNEREQMIHS